MNVVLDYTKEIDRIDDSIKKLLERKIKLPLIAVVIDNEISVLQAKKDELRLELNKEVELVDAYVENVLSKHNSLKLKIK